MEHRHTHGCSCGCQHPQSVTHIHWNGKDIQVKGLIEMLMPYAENMSSPEDLDYGELVKELRHINPSLTIPPEELKGPIREEYVSMLPQDGD